jgi:hypothetical protein
MLHAAVSIEMWYGAAALNKVKVGGRGEFFGFGWYESVWQGGRDGL